MCAGKTVGVSEISDDAKVVKTVYYGIDGMKLAKPVKGSIIIEKQVLENGNVRIKKTMIR